MFFLPSLRRLLIPAVILLVLVTFYRSKHAILANEYTYSITPLLLGNKLPDPPQGIAVEKDWAAQHLFPMPKNNSLNHIPPPKEFYYNGKKSNQNGTEVEWIEPKNNPALQVLFQCPTTPNKHTGHIRLKNQIFNISNIPPNPEREETRQFWNPTIISLPYWSPNQFLLVSRIITPGNFQQNTICEANVCYVGEDSNGREGEKKCTEEDIAFLGPNGGMRCATEPIVLSVPPTPSEKCNEPYQGAADIPGFHDPRIFWSGKGEPLMMVNTQYVLVPFNCSLMINSTNQVSFTDPATPALAYG
jgi:hypothetical protein